MAREAQQLPRAGPSQVNEPAAVARKYRVQCVDRKTRLLLRVDLRRHGQPLPLHRNGNQGGTVVRESGTVRWAGSPGSTGCRSRRSRRARRSRARGPGCDARRRARSSGACYRDRNCLRTPQARRSARPLPRQRTRSPPRAGEHPLDALLPADRLGHGVRGDAANTSDPLNPVSGEVVDSFLGDRGHVAPRIGVFGRRRQSRRGKRAVPEVWQVGGWSDKSHLPRTGSSCWWLSIRSRHS